jgi:hypothetical protein
MRPSLTAEMADVVVQDRIEAAEHFRTAERTAERQRQTARRGASEPDRYETVTVRLAGAQDQAAVRKLAERDGRREPPAPLLVAEAEGRLLAARSLADGRSVADPFQPTAHLTELLALRSVHLHSDGFIPKRAGLRERLGIARRFVHS